MSRPPYVSFPIRSREPGRRVAAADLVASLLSEVRAGHLPPGSRLPPVRVLEQQLGLSKNTAQAAYDELVARGVLESRPREGVFIAAPNGEAAAVTPIATPPLPRLRPAPNVGGGRVQKRGVSLSTVFIDPELLPRERLAECARSVLKSPGLFPFYDPQGYGPLRELVATRLRARGIDVDPGQVVITTGSQQAIDLVARATEVRRVALETPTYAHARQLFETLGLGITALRLDPFEGPPLDRWEAQIARDRPGFLYAVTSFQNPTGYSYSSHELTRILEIAAAHGCALLEDDWGSDMLSGSEYRPMLRLLGGPNVIYVNSFTKKLLPSLRVGFLVAEPSLVPALVALKRISTLGNAWLTEAIVAEFLERGYYDAHLSGLQRELDARYTACLTALEELMPEGVRWTTPGGGPTLWLELPRSVDLAALERRLAEREVFVDSADQAFHGEPHLHGFRLSYAFSPIEALRRGLEALADEIRRAEPSSSARR